MYKISVPITTFVLETYGTETVLEELKKLDCERLFLCPSSEGLFNNKRDEEFERLEKYCHYFQEHGFEVGMWIWTYYFKGECDYVRLTSPFGQKSATQICAADLQYRKVMGKILQDGARCGFDLIMFDDDFRYGFHDIGFGCCCENHLRMMSEHLGESVNLETIRPFLLGGEKNKYRDAFVQANAKAYVDFAKAMRNYVDEINPDLRLGFCACITSWDLDGTTPDRIAEILAGKNKPFYRLIGAPYWGAQRHWGTRLAENIEMERLEATRRWNANIEIFSEGDTHPRPRFRVPASYLEGFDTALRAAGCADGILKYALDYTSDPATENGYRKAHEKNRDVYEKINELFDDKQSIGVRVWDKAAKYADMTIPEKKENSCNIQDTAFSPAIKMLTCCSMPITYGDEFTAGVAFGEDVKAVPPAMLDSGLILDLRACEILMEQGVDVGIEEIGEYQTANTEHFFEPNNYVRIDNDSQFRAVKLKQRASVESEYHCGKNDYPATYRYTNANGQRFFVFCFDAYFNSESLFRMYPRAIQIAAASEWLSGEKMPAVCFGNPDLYLQVKRNGKRLAIGLWNFSADAIDEPIVSLGLSGTVTKTIDCDAESNGNDVVLSPIPAFSFAAVEVEFK
ncbi:MAG TPA: hypothetical protein DDY98_01485 [Ruminococcaceae bacterium]|nr:hypothetical protein [Oscillospiraceae bacterium]